MRIVSLLPSATEIVYALGLDDDLVGVTFECDYPQEARTRTIVSTSTMPEGLTPAEIDAFVAKAVAAGEDLYRLDEGALAGLDADLDVKAEHGEGSYVGSAKLVGRRALVTGADSGIGRAVTIAFAREGADVAMNYLPAEQEDADDVVAAGAGPSRRILPPGRRPAEFPFGDEVPAPADATPLEALVAWLGRDPRWTP